MDYDVTVTHESGRHLAVKRFDARPEEMGAHMAGVFGAVAAHLERVGTPIAGPAVSCYTLGEDTFHVAAGFVVPGPFAPGDGVEPLQLPEVDVVTTTHLGPYDGLAAAYDAVKAGAREHGREVDEAAMMWEEYWSPPETPPEQTRTVVYWPLLPLAA